MTKKWIAINLLLLLAAGLLARQLKTSVASFTAENNVAKIQPGKKKAAQDSRLPAYQPPPKFNDAQVSGIYSQNLFAESRKLEDPAAAAPQPETRTLNNPPILVGSVVIGSQREGIIIDTAAQQPGARRTQKVHVGDVYQGFTVTDITDQNIVLEYGASKNVIPLFDTSKPPQSGKTPILQTRVVGFGGTGGGQGGAMASVIPASGGTGNRPNVTPNVSPGRGNPQQQVVPMQQTGGRGSAQMPQQVPTQPQGGLYPNQYYNAQGQLVTSTPFGPMITQPAVPVQPQQPIKK